MNLIIVLVQVNCVTSFKINSYAYRFENSKQRVWITKPFIKAGLKIKKKLKWLL